MKNKNKLVTFVATFVTKDGLCVHAFERQLAVKGLAGEVARIQEAYKAEMREAGALLVEVVVCDEPPITLTGGESIVWQELNMVHCQQELLTYATAA